MNIFFPIIDETIKLLHKVLENNRLKATDIHEIILVGGSTFVPQVRQQLASEIGIPLNFSSDPTTSIAVGAAYYAANKNYEPSVATKEKIPGKIADDTTAYEEPIEIDFEIETSYNKSSRDSEEVLLVFCKGAFENKFFRVFRNDGGFDTGFLPLKSKNTLFLSLVPSVVNLFHLYLYDHNLEEIKTQSQELSITLGKYTIGGQPLPHDISIEVDDIENRSTRLEVIFERNTTLPQKKILYREISKTIKKGSKDDITINIMEGDKNARPSSNLTIGCVTISGKDLKTDLIKGSDIEIQLHITDSRVLNTAVFLVMSQQEFKNVFSISEKQINLDRLRDQYSQLEVELRETIRQFEYNDNDIWEIKANSLLEELKSVKARLFKLKHGDKSDEKYIIAEKIRRISQEADKLGGNERMAMLVEEYYEMKERVMESIKGVDFEKEEMRRKFQKIEQSEDSFIRSRNLSFIEGKIQQLRDLHWDVLCNTTSFLIGQYVQWRENPESSFKDYTAAKQLIKMADTSLQKESYAEFRSQVFSLTHLMVIDTSHLNQGLKEPALANQQYISIIRIFQHCEISTDDNFNVPRAKKQLQAEFGISKEGFIEVGGYTYTRQNVFEELERPDFLSRLNFHKNIWQNPHILGLLENNRGDLLEMENEFKNFFNNPDFDAFFSPYFAGPFNYLSRSLLTELKLEEMGNLLSYEGFLLPAEREESFRPIRLFLDENLILLRNVNAENYKLMRPKMAHWIDTDWHLFFNYLPHEFYDIRGDIAVKLVNIGVAVQKKHRRDCKKMSQQLVSLADMPEHLRQTISSNHLAYNSTKSWGIPNLKGGFWIGWIILLILRSIFSDSCNSNGKYHMSPSSYKIQYRASDTFLKRQIDSLRGIGPNR